jgi:putative oxidoreductase
MTYQSVAAAWAPRVLSVLRIIAALLFFEHGTMKLVGFPIAGPAHLAPLFLLAGVIETAGGLLLALGLFSRPVALIMSGEMAVAYFKVFAPHGFHPIANHGEAAILFCFIFLYIALAGPGPWSLDGRRGG